MMDPELHLIRASGKGDHEAFETLVKRFQNPLLNFIYRYVGDRQTAEDLTQETFLKVHRAASRFEARGRARVSTWVFKIAYNLSMNEIKHRRRLRVFCDDLHNRAKDLTGQRFSEIMELRALEKEIMSGLNQLPKTQKAALLLRVNQGFSYHEISEVLDVSISSVEALVFRARKGLKKHLQSAEKECCHEMPTSAEKTFCIH